MRPDSRRAVRRRDFLRAGALGAAAAAFGCAPKAKTEPAVLTDEAPTPQPKVAPPPTFSIDLGIQSYSLRNFKFPQVVEMTQQLGLHSIEFFPGHFPANQKPDQLAAGIATLKAAGIAVNAYGVCGFSKNEAAARGLFDFAKKVGFGVITAGPTPDSLDMLDKLVEQYDVKIAIHNHGPGDRHWGKLQQLVDGTKDHHANIGVCLDTGHLERSGDPPIAAIEALGPRLHSLHLKDLNAQKHDVVVGTGTTDLVAFFTALKAVEFDGPCALEYEIEPKNPMPGIRKSLAAIREAVAKIA